MNLEAVEQGTLSYLKEVSKPLVPVDKLLRHLRLNEACADLGEEELIDFLARHELFTLLDLGAGALDSETAKELGAAGFDSGPMVILCTRVPAPEQLALHMKAQGLQLIEALNTALADAKAKGRPERARELIKVIARAEELQKRFDEFA